MIAVEVRGGRTKGVLPTSVVIHLPCKSTVLQVKTELEDYVNPEHTISAKKLKLVSAGRALADDETLHSLQETESKTRGGSGELTMYAVIEPSSTPSSPNRNNLGSLPRTPNQQQPSGLGCEAPPPTPEFFDKLKKQVELNMKRAFFDSIEQALSTSPPDHEWITRLYAEMRDKLCALTPRRTDLHKRIHEALDVEHFEHMVRHQAFDPPDLCKLVSFVFGHVAALCAPFRDSEVKQRRMELEDMLVKENVTFANFAVVFLKHFHSTIDDLEKDLEEFRAHSARSPTAPKEGKRDDAEGVAAAHTHTHTPIASPGSVKDLKSRLQQLGVAEEKIQECVEKRDLLEDLLAQASARTCGTVAGGLAHPSLARKPISRCLYLEHEGGGDRGGGGGGGLAEMNATVEAGIGVAIGGGGAGVGVREDAETILVNFKVMHPAVPAEKSEKSAGSEASAAAEVMGECECAQNTREIEVAKNQKTSEIVERRISTTAMLLARSVSAADARVTLARELGRKASTLTLVFAGRVLADEEVVGELGSAGAGVGGGATVSIHVVVAHNQSSSSN